MKKNLFTILLTVLMSMVGAQTFAYDFWASNSEGKTLYYNFTGGDEVALTRSSSNYWGRIVIPRAVKYGNSYYRVTSIAPYAFEEGSGVTYLFIPNSIRSIGEYAFIDCGNNINVDIESLSDWCNVTFGNEHSSPLSSARAFYIDGNYVRNLSIPYGVQAISNFAFYQCKCISSVSMPGTVKTVGSSAFEDCTGLSWVSLPEGLNTISGSAFEGCTGLSAITIPSTVSAISINAFRRCSNLNDVKSEIRSPFAIDSSVFSTYSTATLTVPRGTKSAYRNTAGWNNFSRITDGTSDAQFSRDGINYTVTSSNTVAVQSAANYLKTVIIPSTVYNAGSYYTVTALGSHSFDGRYDITYLHIPSTIASIGEYAFIDCGSNIQVNIESLSAWCNVTFGNEHSSPLSSASVFYLNGSVVRDLAIPYGVQEIPNFAFYQCKTITSLNIPGTVKKIGSSAFEDCTGLNWISLSEGLETIGGSAFEGCTGLYAVTIPSTVRDILINAFNRCPNLIDITSEIQNPFAIDLSVFNTYDKAILRVPYGTRTAYMTTSGWNRFLNIVDDATGIQKVQVSADGNKETIIYSLNGQMMGRASQRDINELWNNLPKGVYIVNGKKLIK